MKWGLVAFLAIATAALVAFAWLQSGGLKQHAMFSAVTPEEAVQALMSQIQAHNYEQAYASLDRSSDTDLASFTRELAGSDGSLRTYSSLQTTEVSPLHSDGDQALVRVRMNWSSALGSLAVGGHRPQHLAKLGRAGRRLAESSHNVDECDLAPRPRSDSRGSGE